MSDPDADTGDTYTGWTRQALKRFRELLASGDQAGSDIDKLRQDLHRIAHDIKGMGGSFGYPLMTEFGTSLCLYLRSLPEGAAMDGALIEGHLEAMDRILAEEIRGPGSAHEQRLAADLAARVERAVSSAATA